MAEADKLNVDSVIARLLEGERNQEINSWNDRLTATYNTVIYRWICE